MLVASTRVMVMATVILAGFEHGMVMAVVEALHPGYCLWIWPDQASNMFEKGPC